MSYTRKTRDEYDIEQFAYGEWTVVNCEATYKAAVQSRKEYRANQPEYPVRIHHRFVKINQESDDDIDHLAEIEGALND